MKKLRELYQAWKNGEEIQAEFVLSWPLIVLILAVIAWGVVKLF